MKTLKQILLAAYNGALVAREFAAADSMNDTAFAVMVFLSVSSAAFYLIKYA